MGMTYWTGDIAVKCRDGVCGLVKLVAAGYCTVSDWDGNPLAYHEHEPIDELTTDEGRFDILIAATIGKRLQA